MPHADARDNFSQSDRCSVAVSLTRIEASGGTSETQHCVSDTPSAPTCVSRCVRRVQTRRAQSVEAAG